MSHVLILICDPAGPALTNQLLSSAREVLPSAGSWRWLDEGFAAEIPFPGDQKGCADVVASIRTAISQAIGSAPIDVAVVPDDQARRKRLLVSDMDSTMIREECIDELADMVGLKGEIGAVTERVMRGEIAFEPALRERVALLEGLDLTAVSRVVEERITLTPGGRTLVRTMRANGAYTALVSGGFTVFAEAIGASLGFNEARANTLLVEDERLTGKVAEPILGREAKLIMLRELRAGLGLSRKDTLAVGDGANDLAMLGEAGLGVAYRAKPVVAAAAHVRIDHGDLTALLFLQGYSATEFVV